MGRGLSDLQKRILVYARDDGVNWVMLSMGQVWEGMTPWFGALNPRRSFALRLKIQPQSKPTFRRKGSQWPPSESAIVSRALRRLQDRRLIGVYVGKHKRRARYIYLTDRGRELARSLPPIP
jgi:hypothetical protein